MNKFLAFLKSLLPVKFSDPADTVPPDVRRKIEAIEKDAKARADALRAEHSAKTIQVTVDEDLADADRIFARFKSLLKAEAEGKLKEAQVVLPALDLGPSVTDPVK